MPRPPGCCGSSGGGGGGEVTPSPDFFDLMIDYELEILCDLQVDNSKISFIRAYALNQDNTISVSGDFDLDGNPYVVTGTVINCNVVQEQSIESGTQANFIANAPLRVSSYLIKSVSGTVVVDGITLAVGENTTAAADNGTTIPRPTISGGGNYEWRVIY